MCDSDIYKPIQFPSATHSAWTLNTIFTLLAEERTFVPFTNPKKYILFLNNNNANNSVNCPVNGDIQTHLNHCRTPTVELMSIYN